MATKWTYRAEMINACNCDWGCPCNFNAKPTNGYCEGVYAAHITTGRCGETPLDGLRGYPNRLTKWLCYRLPMP